MEKKQKLSVYIDDNMPRILVCDNQRLAQVITNLLSNAVKFTDDFGTIILKVSLLKEEGNVLEIRFDVTDTGLGISDEHRVRLFSPFEQAESSTTRKYGGTGLGLAITKRIVELMEGNISVSSVLGEGSTFSFTIKAEKPDKKVEDRLLSVSIADTQDTSYSGCCVLLVEDVEINREIVRVMLEPFQLEVVSAENGVEAVRLFSETPEKYDLIFMDLQMPEMDGYDATRTIRALDTKNAKTIPIIAMTANVFKEDIHNCFEAGMNDHVGKPIDFNEVMQVINRFLSPSGI